MWRERSRVVIGFCLRTGDEQNFGILVKMLTTKILLKFLKGLTGVLLYVSYNGIIKLVPSYKQNGE